MWSLLSLDEHVLLQTDFLLEGVWPCHNQQAFQQCFVTFFPYKPSEPSRSHALLINMLTYDTLLNIDRLSARIAKQFAKIST